MNRFNSLGSSRYTSSLVVALFIVGLCLFMMAGQTIGSTLSSLTKIDTTLNTTQIDFQPFDPSSPSTRPSYQTGTKATLKFDFFSIEQSSYDTVVVSKSSNKEYQTDAGVYLYKNVGTIENMQLEITIPTEIDTAEGAYIFRLKKKVEKVSQELNFDSPEFSVIVTVDNTSFSWPTIILILFFPPALILVAVIGGCVMCKRQKQVQQQELEQHEYAQQLDDDVDINFDHDEEESRPSTHHTKQTRKKEEPKMAFVLEDDDDDDEPMSSHIHIDDDDENERRGNFYYTKNV